MYNGIIVPFMHVNDFKHWKSYICQYFIIRSVFSPNLCPKMRMLHLALPSTNCTVSPAALLSMWVLQAHASKESMSEISRDFSVHALVWIFWPCKITNLGSQLPSVLKTSPLFYWWLRKSINKCTDIKGGNFYILWSSLTWL